MTSLTCFKAYDIRGKLGEQLNEDIAYRIGRAFAQFLSPKTVVVGGDIRETSATLKAAVAKGLMDEGVTVLDIGMTGTEEVYFATKHFKADGGIEVTASHNPIDYNGMKLVREESKPISGDTGLDEIRRLAEAMEGQELPSVEGGSVKTLEHLPDYIRHLLTYVDVTQLKPLKLVVNSGNGASGHVIDAIEAEFQRLQVPVEFIKLHHEPDGSFPNGIPNPLLPENRADTIACVKEHNADMGIAWDGDFDRCFLFDQDGQFIEGYYIVGLLAEAFLQKHPQEKIIFDPRLTWNTQDIIEQNKGVPIMSKTGHAFIKERMREENAIYGGEMSAHHYFRDFAYCDSGMIPWLLVVELICKTGKPLGQLVQERMDTYPSPGEINSKVKDADETLERVLNAYQADANHIDYTDGIGVEFDNWRFNLRKSNTEPVIRLNLETRGDKTLMREKTDELLQLIRADV
ncbi:phosphomannomutase CpsG [Pleionea sp. CnH1-48]|uniref:phosphomannomutase CpsG n=1 Tax=Pleionea sp. CnH1-48 TaxID=2954494 RepID=UPI002097B25E|nr:phosphomannomutase CpsG [Pleionea sp. CnH1-48]MCO7223779.1 phosphomannomutase CpsG [Pleionea sp. CnH1-48]